MFFPLSRPRIWQLFWRQLVIGPSLRNIDSLRKPANNRIWMTTFITKFRKRETNYNDKEVSATRRVLTLNCFHPKRRNTSYCAWLEHVLLFNLVNKVIGNYYKNRIRLIFGIKFDESQREFGRRPVIPPTRNRRRFLRLQSSFCSYQSRARSRV